MYELPEDENKVTEDKAKRRPPIEYGNSVIDEIVASFLKILNERGN